MSQVTNFLNKFLFKEKPGPGYYYDDKYHSCFRPKYVADKFQTFGSGSSRFIEQENKDPYMGPGAYFRDDTKLEKLKSQKYREQMNVKVKPKRKHSADLQSLERIVENHKGSPGPGHYNPNKDLNTKVKGTNGIFGSAERRFIEPTKDKTTPGPGSYIATKTTGKIEAGLLSKLLTKPTRIIKEEKDSKEREEKNDIPAVGSYNSEIYHSIAYKIAKNANQFNMVNAPFSSLEINRFKEIDKSSSNNLGPGYYHKEPKVMAHQNLPAFNNGEKRFGLQAGGLEVGPGDYNQGSYFDWNKKSYNVLYL